MLNQTKSYPLIGLSKPNQIFVFGSNLAGRHGAGAALYAHKNYGAQIGKGVGRTGRCYAIPTKDHKLRTMDLSTIKAFVDTFLKYAKHNQHLEFMLTPIGTGLAGYKHTDIMPMFENSPSNIIMPEIWLDIWVVDRR